MSDPIKWACPQCGTDYAGNHSSPEETEKCRHRSMAGCQFTCECDHDVAKEHGDSLADRCMNASCDHCGWYGEFPPIPWKKKDLPAWAKKALDAGWTPPKGWEPPPKKEVTK